MSELQPGMLALVIGCTRNPANIGRTVTAEKIVKNGDIGPNGRIFSDDGAGCACWFVSGKGLSMSSGGVFVESDFCYIAAKHLLPIPPLSDPLHEKQQQELHA